MVRFSRSALLLISAIVIAAIGLGVTPAFAGDLDGARFDQAVRATGEASTVVKASTVSAHGLGISGGVRKQLRLLPDGGIQGLAVVKSNSTITWNLRLPAGTRLGSVNGSFAVIDKVESNIAVFDAPWARDATGRPVRTWYSAMGHTLVQHVGTGVGHIVADPSVHFCDWYLKFCVKFSRSETRFVADKVLIGVGAFTASFCGLFPAAGYLLLVRAACTGLAATYFYVLRNTFVTAKAENRCVQLKYPLNGIFPTSWKRVNC